MSSPSSARFNSSLSPNKMRHFNGENGDLESWGAEGSESGRPVALTHPADDQDRSRIDHHNMLNHSYDDDEDEELLGGSGSSSGYNSNSSLKRNRDQESARGSSLIKDPYATTSPQVEQWRKNFASIVCCGLLVWTMLWVFCLYHWPAQSAAPKKIPARPRGPETTTTAVNQVVQHPAAQHEAPVAVPVVAPVPEKKVVAVVPGTPLSEWPDAPPRFDRTPAQKATEKIPDALRFTCEGQPVKGIKDGADYLIYMLPFEDSTQGRAVADKCLNILWERYSEEGKELNWGHFEKVYDVTTVSRQDPDRFPPAHNWRPALNSGKHAKEKFFSHMKRQFLGTGAATLYSFMVRLDTRTSVWTGVWQHPYGYTEANDILRSGYFWEVQVAKEDRGHGSCATAVSNMFDHAQRLYNSRNPNDPSGPSWSSEYLARLWPGLGVDASSANSYYLRKIMIADASWESITMDFASPRAYASKEELEKYRWEKHGSRAQAPGVLMNTLKTYADSRAGGVYLVDNYEPVDINFYIGNEEVRGTDINFPQPVDRHFGNTYGCKCYRSAWNEADKTGIHFQEPAIILSGWGTQQIHYDIPEDQKAASSQDFTETVQDWRYTYSYDVARYGEQLSNKRITPLPEAQWIKDDTELLARKQAGLYSKQQPQKASSSDGVHAVAAPGGR
ncbi:unnamed protein product [Amoebophrya sp. A25]|nr:unnamed protein product [Amoebophrya sp. A25]|eukprot:GSA25T00016146001.1